MMASETQSADLSEATCRTRRVLAYRPDAVFDAFARPELLAAWWGPDGFTNTFEVFEFRPGGRWKFVMHGPNNAHFPNESVFLELSMTADAAARGWQAESDAAQSDTTTETTEAPDASREDA